MPGGALENRGEVDRATWHRAAAALEPDEDLAAALAAIGERASRRGGYLTAADTLARAADLTPSPSARAARLFAAARNAWSSGQPARATALVTAAREQADDPLLVADIDRLRGRIAVNAGSAPDAHRIFTRAAEAVATHDPVRALEMAVAAAVARGHGVDSGSRLRDDVIDTAPSDGDGPRVRSLKLLLASTRSEADGDFTAALNRLHEAMESTLGDTGVPKTHPQTDPQSGPQAGPGLLVDVDLLGNLANQALHLGDDDAHRRFYSLMLGAAKETGDGMTVLYALQRLTFSLYIAGAWAELRSTAEEAVALGAGLGQLAQTVPPHAWLTVLAALEGRADYDGRLAELEQLLETHPPVGILAQPVHDLSRWARGLHALHAGDSAGAHHHFQLMALPALTGMAAPDRLEAAARAGDTTQLERWTRDLEGPAAGSAAFGRALIAEASSADSDTVASAYETALRLYAGGHRRYDRARIQLAYGEYLRRAQRRVDARPHLRAAVETFTDLRAAPLAERAGQELRASGETARKRNPSTALELTPMELKVARLVSQGLSNKDVAAQCWVSPRTVAFHLRGVFTKTGITSRGELAHLDLG
jgi:DNA-binding CsgD family transcriptional regulator